MAQDIVAAVSNDREHLYAVNGPEAHAPRLQTQWDRVCRSVKTLAAVFAYTRVIHRQKSLPPDAASYCALPGPILGQLRHGPIRRRFIDARFRARCEIQSRVPSRRGNQKLNFLRRWRHRSA